jgi:hypothetical protein
MQSAALLVGKVITFVAGCTVPLPSALVNYPTGSFGATKRSGRTTFCFSSYIAGRSVRLSEGIWEDRWPT